MRFFTWPPLVDLDAREVRIAPIHALAAIAGAGFILLLIALAMAVLS